MSAPIIEIRGLKKQFNPPDGVIAVNGVTFEIRQGEIFSLLGPNGAGKTTTISMMSGLLTPTEGDVLFDGHSIIKEPLAVKKMIGVVPQELAIYPTLSTRQNLTFFGKMYGLRGSELKKRVDEVIDFTGLADRADDPVEEYSGGMKRRVNIGIGLLHRPQIIFLDEPTVAIDPQSRRNILDAVKALNAQGITVFYTTHYMEEAQELSHRVGIIDHGEIIALGTQPELTQMVGEHDTRAAQCAGSVRRRAGGAVRGRRRAEVYQSGRRRRRDPADGEERPPRAARRDPCDQRGRAEPAKSRSPGADARSRVPAPDRARAAGLERDTDKHG